MTSLRQLSTWSLALTAAVLVSGYPIFVVAANIAQRDDYSAAREAMSDLALGRDGWLMTLAFVSLGIGNLLMAVLVRRMAPRANIGPAFLAASACTTLLSAVFQTDSDGAPSTMHGTIHIALGLGSFVLVIASMAACGIAYIRSGSCRRLGVASLIWAGVEFGSIVLTFALADSLFGVGQRAILAVAISWLLTTCVIALRTPAFSTSRARSAVPSAGLAR